MITAEVKVNGRLIAHIYAHNLGAADQTPESHSIERCRYFWEYYEVNGHRVKQGHVTHVRSEGAARLLARILDAMDGVSA